MKLIVVIVFLSFNLYAQESASGSASVYVVRPLSIETRIPDLDFGEIILTGSPFSVSVVPLNGAKFLITGHPSRGVVINFDPITLDNSQWVSTFGGTTGQISFTPEVTKNNGNVIISGDSYQLNNNGKLRIFLGGRIDIAANQPRGDYSGTFVVNVSY